MFRDVHVYWIQEYRPDRKRIQNSSNFENVFGVENKPTTHPKSIVSIHVRILSVDVDDFVNNMKPIVFVSNRIDFYEKLENTIDKLKQKILAENRIE